MKISCVMPTWNRAHCIQNAIRSVLDQTFKDFELIIVDDGSTDPTERIVNTFVHPKIKYFKIPHTGHISQVRNYGNQQAQGELIIVQDSDDMSFPDRFEKIWNKYQKTKADVIYHNIYVRSYDPEHNAVGLYLRRAGKYDKEKAVHQQYIAGQMAYRAEIAQKLPYDERIQVCDDFQLIMEFALNNLKFAYIDQGLYEYNFVEDSANYNGELDGRRFEDAKIIVSILKEKYNIEATGQLKKWELMTGRIIKEETV